MKKIGGTRTPATRGAVTTPREPWRKWIMTLLALGFAMLVITLLSKENKMLLVDLRNATASVPEVAAHYPVSFTLPTGWIMTEGCGYVGSTERGRCDEYEFTDVLDPRPVLDTDISSEATTVYLQNTDKFPLFGGIGPNEAVASEYQSNDVALIEVTKIDGQEILTGSMGEVTDMGGNFYKVETCDSEVNGPECGIYGGWTHEYYFFGETGTYRMSVRSTWSGGSEAIEEIVFSAQEK